MTWFTGPTGSIDLDEKIESLIAIGAATASNCIPCFEHLYERALACGLTAKQIKSASDIAARVKKGAHTAISNSINEMIGDKESTETPCAQATRPPCCCG